MSLSFRERAAIDLAAASYSLDVSAPDEPSRYVQCTRTAEESAIDAQDLADACCEAWGHSSPVNKYRCERCGAELKGASK